MRTPGPWKWERRYSDGRHVATLLVTEHRPIRLNDPVIFAVREDWMADESRAADRDLIAASPDLLAALLGTATDRCEDGSPCWCGNTWEDGDEDPHAAYCRDARAAVAKAGGREP